MNWRERLTAEQLKELPPKSGETMFRYASRWRRYADDQSQAKFNEAFRKHREGNG